MIRKLVTRDKDGHFMMIKGTIPQDINNTYRYTYSQSGTTKIYKETTNRTKGRN